MTTYLALQGVSMLVRAALDLALIGVAAVWVKPAIPRAWPWLVASGAVGLANLVAMPVTQAAATRLVYAGDVITAQGMFVTVGTLGAMLHQGLLLWGLVQMLPRSAAPEGSPFRD